MYIALFIFFFILMFTDRNKISRLKFWSLLFSILLLILFIIQNLKFSNFDNLQFTNLHSWSNPIGLGVINTMFYVDGISHFFIGLSIMLIVICYLISWENIEYLNKEFIILIYMTLIILIGVFTTSDLLLFYILFESSLIPLFLLIGIWGSREEKVRAAFYFFFLYFNWFLINVNEYF